MLDKHIHSEDYASVCSKFQMLHNCKDKLKVIQKFRKSYKFKMSNALRNCYSTRNGKNDNSRYG
jgi:hypothetical protein